MVQRRAWPRSCLTGSRFSPLPSQPEINTSASVHSWKSKCVSSVCPGLRGRGEKERNPKFSLSFLINSTRETAQLSSGGGCGAGSARQDLQNKNIQEIPSVTSPHH